MAKKMMAAALAALVCGTALANEVRQIDDGIYIVINVDNTQAHRSTMMASGSTHFVKIINDSEWPRYYAVKNVFCMSGKSSCAEKQDNIIVGANGVYDGNWRVEDTGYYPDPGRYGTTAITQVIDAGGKVSALHEHGTIMIRAD